MRGNFTKSTTRYQPLQNRPQESPIFPHLRHARAIVLNPSQVSRRCNKILILTYNDIRIGATKRPRESADDEHQVEEQVPEHQSLPSPERALNESPPAKRPRMASISRVPSPRPVKSRVRARQPARKGKKAAIPGAIEMAGESKEVAGKGIRKGQTFTDGADTSKETDKTDKRVPGTSEDANTEGVNDVPADGMGHSSEERTQGRIPNKVVDNDATHSSDVESETKAGKKPLQQKASKKGEQVDMV